VDRQLWRLAVLAAPLALLFSVSYGIAGGAAQGRLISIGVPTAAFLATGLIAWELRPANPLGRLMVATGLCLALAPVRGQPWPDLAPLGVLAGTGGDVLLGYLILSFPSGRLGSAAARWLVVATGALLLAPRLVILGANPVDGDSAVAGLAAAIQPLVDLAVVTTYLGYVVLRWARASRPGRSALAPVAIPAVVLLVTMLAATALSRSELPLEIRVLLSRTQDLARAAIPFGFLLGLLRTRVARGAVADLVVELGRTPTPSGLRDALARAVGDPTLQVAYWSPDGYVDGAGAPLTLPDDADRRGVTRLARDGAPLAAILHDPSLLEDPGLVASVGSAVRLAVENERLSAQVGAQLDEVRASRVRIVEAGDEQRKRVERDLHDGAQQRLVALTLALRLARSKLGEGGDPELRLRLDQAVEEARAALAELRALARGIHPQVLSEAGLGAAIESLAGRSPVPVSLDIGAGRFAPPVEQTAYFVVSEALANVAKYAGATHARVSAAWAADVLVVAVADDGVGGAAIAGGSGLRGLVDRLAALDGTLEIASPRGGGTRLVARIPSLAPTLAG
jgi:signal transduction histidine kinase